MMKNSCTNLLMLVWLCFFFISQSHQAQIITTTFSYASVANSNTGTIGSFTVPQCVTQMSIEVWGASGGYNPQGSGGSGARMSGVFSVTAGQVLYYLVGKSPGALGSGEIFPGGGGGSYVATGTAVATASPLIVAGGGGGGYNSTGVSAPITTSGTGITPGTNGNGAPANACAGGGGGFYSSGGTSSLYLFVGGQGFQQGGTGGSGNQGTYNGYQFGGFGGGATADYVGSCFYTGGAGGGYSGGSAWSTASQPCGAAGGSYNAGTNQSNTAGYNQGHGKIIFTYLPGSPIFALATPSTPICQGGSVVLNVSGVLTYTWDNGSNATTRTVSPSSNTTYTVLGTNAAGCITTLLLPVNVNNSVPVLSINTSTNAVCLGRTVTLTASGAYSYTWSGGPVNGISFTPSVTASYVVTGANGCGTSTAVTTISVNPLPVTMVSSPTVVCAGNNASITAVTTATSFTWFPISNLTASLLVSPQVLTVYSVAVSDGTCFGNGTVAINALPVPTINATPSLTTVCSGNMVALNATGGISYTWSPGNLGGASVTMTPNSPTAYQVTGSNSVGCMAFANVAVITNPNPTINLVVNQNLICSGTQVNLVAGGANTYTWYNGANTNSIAVNPTTSTIYTVTGATNSCVTSATAAISVFIPTLSITGNTSICNGQSATLSASGGNMYNWSNGFTSTVVLVNPTSSTIYSVAALTNSSGINCPSSASFQVIVNPLPSLTLTPARIVMCRGESNSITVSGAATYVWNTGATGTIIAITPTLAATNNYSVIGTGSMGCSSTGTTQVKINACVGLQNFENTNPYLSVFPNPNQGVLEVTFSKEMQVKITDGLGRVVEVLHNSGEEAQNAFIQNLPAGVYYLIAHLHENTYTQKIIVQ